MFSVFKSILQNISINELTNCRDIFEIKEFLQKFGYTLNFEEINQFKEFLNAKPKKDSAPGVLSLSELYDVAGGINGVIIHADGRCESFKFSVGQFKIPMLLEIPKNSETAIFYMRCIATKLVEQNPIEELKQNPKLYEAPVYDFTLNGNVYPIHANSFGFRYTLFDLFNRKPEYLKKYLGKGEDKKQLDSSNEENSHHLNSLARSVTPPIAPVEHDDVHPDLSASDSCVLRTSTNSRPTDLSASVGRTYHGNFTIPEIKNILCQPGYRLNFDGITEDMLKSTGGDVLVLRQHTGDCFDSNEEDCYHANMHEMKGVLEILKNAPKEEVFKVLPGLISSDITKEQIHQIYDFVKENYNIFSSTNFLKKYSANLSSVDKKDLGILNAEKNLYISAIVVSLLASAIVAGISTDEALGDPLDL